MKQRIYFHTLGCRLNQSETASIQNTFKAHQGYEVVEKMEKSDIVVINTCTVTEASDDDTRYLARKINRLNPSARIALVGCQAQVQRGELAHLTNVRWIVGNGRKMDLLSVFEEHPSPSAPQVIVPVIQRKAFTHSATAIDTDHTRANVKIQDGCDFFCSFCEIPYARGRARSRVWQDILREGNALVHAGHKELILTGINIGTYSFENKMLIDVIKGLETIEGLQRIRISSIEPTTIPEDLLDWMAGGHKLCRYLHVPLQSGDDDILQAMQRKYNTEEFSRFIHQAKKTVPQICVGTDVMVGFPGESQGHFERTLEFLKETPVDYFHVFSYSPRKDAKSRLMTMLAVETIHQRSAMLRQLSGRKRRLFQESLLGSTQLVLFEKPKGDGWQNGLTDHYVRVKVKAPFDLFNNILPVQLKGIDGQDVWGQLID